MSTENLDILHSGRLYDPNDERILTAQRACLSALAEFNQSTDPSRRYELMRGMFQKLGRNVYIEPPLRANWGGHFVSIGADVYANFNLTLVDDTYIKIGHHVMIGPNVTIATALHPENAEQRARGLQYNRPVTIGDNVWIAAGVIICPGVTIGDNTIVGAGSVVLRDLPAGVVAAGNPCRVIREVRSEPHA